MTKFDFGLNKNHISNKVIVHRSVTNCRLRHASHSGCKSVATPSFLQGIINIKMQLATNEGKMKDCSSGKILQKLNLIYKMCIFVVGEK